MPNNTLTSPVPKGRKRASDAQCRHPAARPEVSFTTAGLPAPVVGGPPHRGRPAAQQDTARPTRGFTAPPGACRQVRTLTGADQGITEITDAEMEQIAPGTIQQVTETVLGHFPSEQMYAALYAEVRELAQTVVTHMNPEHREAFLNATREKVREARAQKENG